MTTPPIPSSSPGGVLDSMDISPLPHKAPYQVVTTIEVQSPTPETTPTDPIHSYRMSMPESPLDSVKTIITAE